MNPQTLKYPDGFEGYYYCVAEKNNPLPARLFSEQRQIFIRNIWQWVKCQNGSIWTLKVKLIFIKANFNMGRHPSLFKLMEAIYFWLIYQHICCILLKDKKWEGLSLSLRAMRSQGRSEGGTSKPTSAQNMVRSEVWPNCTKLYLVLSWKHPRGRAVQPLWATCSPAFHP